MDFSGRRAFRGRVERNAARRRAEVGRRLRERRKELKKRPDVVAKALGYDRSVLSRIETGRRKLDLIEAENFAVYYGFDLGSLATWKTQQEADNARVQDLKLAGDMVLTRDEFSARETKAIEQKKRQRRTLRHKRSSKIGLDQV